MSEVFWQQLLRHFPYIPHTNLVIFLIPANVVWVILNSLSSYIDHVEQFRDEFGGLLLFLDVRHGWQTH